MPALLFFVHSIHFLRTEPKFPEGQEGVFGFMSPLCNRCTGREIEVLINACSLKN